MTKKPKIDPANNPRLAAALASLSKDLRPGEDPLYIDFRAREAERAAGMGEGAREYVAPIEVPVGPVPVAEAGAKVEVAKEVDPRWADTQPSARVAAAKAEATPQADTKEQTQSPWAAGEKIDPASLPSSYVTHAPATAAAPASTKPVGSDKPAPVEGAARPGRWLALAGGALLFLALGAALSWMLASPGPAEPEAPATASPVQSAAAAPVAPTATAPTEAPTPAAATSASAPEEATTNVDAGASGSQARGVQHAAPPRGSRPPAGAAQPEPMRKEPTTDRDPAAPPQTATSQQVPPPENPFILD